MTKRLRFEILRRDNHQCRYCGGALQWDHMTTGPQWPVVLLCERCGRPFQTDVIRALCGACQRAQEVAGLNQPYYQDDSVTLYLGDCLEVTEWLAADVLVSDPPYGIPGGRLSSHSGGVRPVHDDAQWDSLETRDAALALWGGKPSAVFGSPKMQQFAPPHRGVPLIWDKGDDPGMGDWKWPFGANYELIWVSGENWNGIRRSSILRARRLTSDAATIGHPTPKPVSLMEVLLSYAPPGVIADPFTGGGSTLVAARNLGRKAIGVELEERYCEIAARRLDQMCLDFGTEVGK